MRIYRLETIGSLDGLVGREEADPVPSAGEVLVRVKASALNFRDLAIVLGKAPFPVRPGAHAHSTRKRTAPTGMAG